jgi:hypothetical protein
LTSQAPFLAFGSLGRSLVNADVSRIDSQGARNAAFRNLARD